MAQAEQLRPAHSGLESDLIAANIHDKHSVGPSIRPVGTRCCFTMTSVIRVCSNFFEPEYMSQMLVWMRSCGQDLVRLIKKKSAMSSPQYEHACLAALFFC